MTLEEAFDSHDMNEIMDSMTVYAYCLIKTIEIKELQGKMPEDIVGEVLIKVAEGDRDWSKAKCSFKEFLFGCLKSHIFNFLKSMKNSHESEIPDIEGNMTPIESVELYHIAIKILTSLGADEEELDVFNCWVEGILQPSEIADLLGKTPKDLYVIIKRLKRKTHELQTQIKHYL